jgi:hypothetical protein
MMKRDANDRDVDGSRERNNVERPDLPPNNPVATRCCARGFHLHLPQHNPTIRDRRTLAFGMHYQRVNVKLHIFRMIDHHRQYYIVIAIELQTHKSRERSNAERPDLFNPSTIIVLIVVKSIRYDPQQGINQ